MMYVVGALRSVIAKLAAVVVALLVR